MKKRTTASILSGSKIMIVLGDMNCWASTLHVALPCTIATFLARTPMHGGRAAVVM